MEGWIEVGWRSRGVVAIRKKGTAECEGGSRRD